MTYAQAKLRIWNPKSYSAAEVKEAAIHILGRMDTTDGPVPLPAVYASDDLDQAALLL